MKKMITLALAAAGLALGTAALAQDACSVKLLELNHDCAQRPAGADGAVEGVEPVSCAIVRVGNRSESMVANFCVSTPSQAVLECRKVVPQTNTTMTINLGTVPELERELVSVACISDEEMNAIIEPT